MNLTTRRITRAAVIAALYVTLTLVTFPIASGAIQFRPSEALTLLPLFMPEAILGIWIGCILANWITGCVLLDIIFGSLITLIAGCLTYLVGRLIRQKPFVSIDGEDNQKALEDYNKRNNILNIVKIVVGGIFPILGNAFFLPLIWLWAYGELEYVYWLQFAFLVATEALAIYTLGTLFCIALYRAYYKKPVIVK